MNWEQWKQITSKTWLSLAFGIVPILIYWFGIRPDFQRISSFEKSVYSSQLKSIWQSEIALASEQELTGLKSIQGRFLGRIKSVANQDDLLRLSSTLSDALAYEARREGLKILAIELQGDLLKGRYVPDNPQALQKLAQWPGAALQEAQKPLSLPALELPSFDLVLSMTGEYSQIFTFTEQLPLFPTLVSLTGISTEGSQNTISYSLKIRCYYGHGAANAQRVSLQQDGLNDKGKQKVYEN